MQAVQQATAAGLVVVTSAGNIGAQPGRPAWSGYARHHVAVQRAVGDLRRRREHPEHRRRAATTSVAPYSSRGPTWYDGFAKPDVLAPGHKLASDTSVDSYSVSRRCRRSQGQSANGQPLLSLSGTSMAAGVASGVVALVLDAHNRNGFNQQPPLTPNAVKAILEYTAIPVAGAELPDAGRRRDQRARARWRSPARSTRRSRSARGGWPRA